MHVMLEFQCMHNNLLTARKVVPISEGQQRKSKLNTTSGAVYKEVMVNTKEEVHI